jgi:hypothetical protein
MIKTIIKIAYCLMLLCGCSSDYNTSNTTDAQKNMNIDSTAFDSFVLSYTPHNIDLSVDLNDTLKFFNVEFLFNHSSNYQKEKWVSIILLKQYLNHLRRANQGYDLYSMRKGETEIIINEFIKANKMDSLGEFLNSGCVVDRVLKKETLYKNKAISIILTEIDKEEQRILTQPTY